MSTANNQIANLDNKLRALSSTAESMHATLKDLKGRTPAVDDYSKSSFTRDVDAIITKYLAVMNLSNTGSTKIETRIGEYVMVQGMVSESSPSEVAEAMDGLAKAQTEDDTISSVITEVKSCQIKMTQLESEVTKKLSEKDQSLDEDLKAAESAYAAAKEKFDPLDKEEKRRQQKETEEADEQASSNMGKLKEIGGSLFGGKDKEKGKAKPASGGVDYGAIAGKVVGEVSKLGSGGPSQAYRDAKLQFEIAEQKRDAALAAKAARDRAHPEETLAKVKEGSTTLAKLANEMEVLANVANAFVAETQEYYTASQACAEQNSPENQLKYSNLQKRFKSNETLWNKVKTSLTAYARAAKTSF